MSETAAHSEHKSSHAAEHAMSSRRQVLNERLLKWGKWFIGGTAVGLAGFLTWPVAPAVGLTLGIAGGAAETVGGIGILGNVIKRIKKSNR